ncbi:MAG TPA: sigma-54 dependent transcriptional regulator [Candidatus Acidoferrales bacterium]|nr:sigma-54 dependent transcriptional regulator [Candidatus Acidoferrales bacterium]
MSASRILVVEDDESLRRVTQVQLERCGYQVSAAEDVPQALELLGKEPKDLVITDLNLPGESGLDLLKKIKAEHPETSVVMVTAFGTIETAVEAMKAGAYDYITKPVHPDELRSLVGRVLERHRLLAEVSALRTTLDHKYGFESIVGRSKALLHVLDSAARVAHTDATVLILGETGTGKEMLAKAIHINSTRKERPFVTINCGAIPGELLESELFGYVKGSFTGAISHKKGKVEMADGGTLFLDEIGEMPLDLQVRVLRLLQQREIDKVGATKSITVDVRIIAATHRNLEERIAAGAFREDLYYRLAVIPIRLPPLRERRDDIVEFVHTFLERAKTKYSRPELRIPSSLMPCLENYRWPGNVRELENLIERIVLLSRSNEVTANDLPEVIRNESAAPALPLETPKTPAPAAAGTLGLEAAEREMIVDALRKSNWNQSRAARLLEISRKTLLYRMSKYAIEKEGPGQEPAAGQEETDELNEPPQSGAARRP